MPKIRDELKKYQPVVYQVLNNALKNNRLSHCYLFAGPHGTMKLEAAYLLAQSLVCEKKEDGWACEECGSCRRMKNGNYADFKYLDGTVSLIKNKDILDLQSQFHQTALESAGRKVFIINGCENMTAKSANSLLKFIEEPSGSLTGIFITEQLERVLPTIVSRCQSINFQPANRLQLYEDAVANGMDELSAHLTSQMASSRQEMQVLSTDPEFSSALMIFAEFMNYYFRNPASAVIYLQENGFKGPDKKSSATMFRHFLTIATIFVNDYYNGTEIEDETWTGLLDKARDCSFDSVGFLNTVSQCRDALIIAVNVPLLIDQFLYKLSGGADGK